MDGGAEAAPATEKTMARLETRMMDRMSASELADLARRGWQDLQDGSGSKTTATVVAGALKKLHRLAPTQALLLADLMGARAALLAAR